MAKRRLNKESNCDISYSNNNTKDKLKTHFNSKILREILATISSSTLLVKLTVFIYFIANIQCQQYQATICSDDYKINTYPLNCDLDPSRQQAVSIVRVNEIFAKKGQASPDCQDTGTPYNYSKPFADYCYGKRVCEISAAFLDENKLFEAETYFLTDTSLYLKPYRIDITFQCLGLSSFTTTSKTTIIRTTTAPIAMSTTRITTTIGTTTTNAVTTSTTTTITTARLTTSTSFNTTPLIANTTTVASSASMPILIMTTTSAISNSDTNNSRPIQTTSLITSTVPITTPTTPVVTPSNKNEHFSYLSTSLSHEKLGKNNYLGFNYSFIPLTTASSYSYPFLFNDASFSITSSTSTTTNMNLTNGISTSTTSTTTTSTTTTTETTTITTTATKIFTTTIASTSSFKPAYTSFLTASFTSFPKAYSFTPFFTRIPFSSSSDSHQTHNHHIISSNDNSYFSINDFFSTLISNKLYEDTSILTTRQNTRNNQKNNLMRNNNSNIVVNGNNYFREDSIRNNFLNFNYKSPLYLSTMPPIAPSTTLFPKAYPTRAFKLNPTTTSKKSLLDSSLYTLEKLLKLKKFFMTTTTTSSTTASTLFLLNNNDFSNYKKKLNNILNLLSIRKDITATLNTNENINAKPKLATNFETMNNNFNNNNNKMSNYNNEIKTIGINDEINQMLIHSTLYVPSSTIVTTSTMSPVQTDTTLALTTQSEHVFQSSKAIVRTNQIQVSEGIMNIMTNNLTDEQENLMSKSTPLVSNEAATSVLVTLPTTTSDSHFTELEYSNNKPTIVYSNLNNIKIKYKSFKDSSLLTTTTTANLASTNNADRIVMIVLIVLGVFFFLIILSIIALICIRRRNQKKLDREFGYKSTDKVSNNSSQFARVENLNTSNMNTIDSKTTSSIREKSFSTPFAELSNSSPVINYENTSETTGTYRSRIQTNNAYDNSDNSLGQQKKLSGYQHTESNSNSFSALTRHTRVDYDEYWRTNI